jgi:hypothetical protein
LGNAWGKKVWADLGLALAGNGVGPHGERRKEKEEKRKGVGWGMNKILGRQGIGPRGLRE